MRTVVATALLLAAGSSFAQEFRGTTWMMSKQQVIASEGGRAVSELSQNGEEQVVLSAIVDGLPARITYLLQNNALLSASYTFTRDREGRAWVAMMQDLTARNGPPAFERENLAGWRLAKTEIALAHLRDGTTYVAYWEKSYFARINHLPQQDDPAKN